MTDRRSQPTSSKEGRIEPSPASKPTFQLVQPIQPPRRGDSCPQCHKGKLDYDGFLNLVCPVCGFSGGAGGCT